MMARTLTKRAVLVHAALAFAIALNAGAQTKPDNRETLTVSQFNVPLTNGRIEVRELVQKLTGELGIELPPQLADVDWSIDVEGMVGRTQLKAIEQLANGAISIAIEPNQLTVSIDRAAMHRALLDAERKAEGWLNGANQPKATQESFGLTYLNSSESQTKTPQHAVVLIHGLDDPGMMWNDLIPHLQEAKFPIAIFRYPNDGPIAESADLLARTLEKERSNGLRRVDIVAHSMGGLVVRDVLTRPGHYDGDGAGGERFPSIDRFIMIGTPNHGAMMARYRFVTQAGEQISRMINGQGLAPVDAGSGEAGIDLLPESDFLRRLNERQLARHTKHTNIIGQCVMIESDRLTRFFEGALEAVEATSDDPAWRKWLSRENMEAAARGFQSAGDSLGDGCVSIDSARVEGIDDFVILRGNHVSVLWNGPLSDDIPPVVPVVLERLKTPASE